MNVRVYELDDGAEAEAVVPTGKDAGVAAVLKATRKGKDITLNLVQGSLNTWVASLFIKGAEVESVQGGSLAPQVGDGEGIAVTVAGGEKSVVFKLK